MSTSIKRHLYESEIKLEKCNGKMLHAVRHIKVTWIGGAVNGHCKAQTVRQTEVECELMQLFIFVYRREWQLCNCSIFHTNLSVS